MATVRKKRSLWKLAVLLAPFATAAAAINLFLVGLMLPKLDLPSLSPLQAMLWAIPLGIPATLASALWVRSLIARAEDENSHLV